MHRRKARLAVLLAILLILAFSASVRAGVEQNPNVFMATDVSCDNGFESESLFLVGRAGHVSPGAAGIATSVYLLNVAPEPVEVINVPGQGLDQVTTWCVWTQDDLRVGGDIVLRGNLR